MIYAFENQFLELVTEGRVVVLEDTKLHFVDWLSDWELSAHKFNLPIDYNTIAAFVG